MSEDRALATISEARRALAECKTLDDFRNFRDVATALRSYLKARGAGVETENEAAELVLRAERAAGSELIRMGEADELATRRHSGVLIRAKGRTGYRPFEANGQSAPLLLRELGIHEMQARYWKSIASIPDADFEGELREARALGKRIAKTDFYRLARLILGTEEKRQHVDTRGDPGDEWSAAWDTAYLALVYLDELIDQGWPLLADRSRGEWEQIAEQINEAGAGLLRFQRRVNAHRLEGVSDQQGEAGGGRRLPG